MKAARSRTDAGLPALTGDIVVLARRTAAGSELVVVGDGPVPADLELGVGPELVERVRAAMVASTLRKVRQNASALPGFALAAAALSKGAGTARPAPLARSSRSAQLAVDAALRTLGLLHRLGSGRKLAVEYLNEVELSLIERWFTWTVTRGEQRHREIALALVEGGVSLQLALFHAIVLQRCREDVEGMSGSHAPEAVAISARTAFQQLARVLAAARGVLASGEEGLCWSRRDAGFSPSWLGQGLCPDPQKLGSDIVWLRSAIERELELLRESWQFRLFWGASHLEVRSNTAPAASSPVAARTRSAPRTTPELDACLAPYATSSAELVSRIPALAAESAVRLVGSVAEGLGHARSDLDVVVLVPRLPELKGSSASVAAGHLECYAGVTSTGHSVCIEYLSDAALERVRRWFDECEAALAAQRSGLEITPEILRLARSSPLAKLAQRACFGHSLRSGALAEHWESAIPAARYAELLVRSHLLEASHQELRARRWVAAGEALAANCAARLGWEHTLLAWLASRRRFVWSKRWIAPWLERELAATTAEPFIQELFPKAVDPEYVERVASRSARLREQLERRSSSDSDQRETRDSRAAAEELSHA